MASLTQVVEDRKKELSRGLETKNKTLAEIQRKLKTKAVKLQDTMDDLKKSNFLSDYNLLNVDCALNRVLPISDGEDLEDLKYSLHFNGIKNQITGWELREESLHKTGSCAS